MRRDERDVQRAARRARRLAARAEERANRAERHARRTAERAERLSVASRQRPPDRGHGQSFEDMVDGSAENAEHWLEDQAKHWTSPADEREIRRAGREAQRAGAEASKARENAQRAGRAAEELSAYRESLFAGDLDEARPRRRYGSGRSRRGRRRVRSAHLYRDRANGKFLGVCAGIADYFGRAPWEIRLYTVLGLFFIPSVTLPAYFIACFIMDDKPYYRRFTDRFEEFLDSGGDDTHDARMSRRSEAMGRERKQPAMDNVQAMKTAREKFSDIEQRLRGMESHVTSSRFELNREFHKIAGDS